MVFFTKEIWPSVQKMTPGENAETMFTKAIKAAPLCTSLPQYNKAAIKALIQTHKTKGT